MNGFTFDIAHLFAGGLVLVSFMMIYQDRLPALINVFFIASGRAGDIRSVASLCSE